MTPPPLLAASPGALYFLADLHLDSGPSPGQRALIDLLSILARPPRPAGLYILGDLFDVWSGKGSMADPGHQPVISAIRRLADSGVPVTLLRGNHDFLLDGGFAGRTRSRVVAEGLPIRLGARRAYLCHGDHLFTEDRVHQNWRVVLRSALCRYLAATFPARLVDAVSFRIRGTDRSAGPRRPREVGVIPARSAARVLRGGFDLLIAGHVHDERRRQLTLDGRSCELWTLGGWEERGSVLEFSGESLQFRAFPFAKEVER